MYKAIAQSVAATGLATALILPSPALALDKPTVEPKVQEVKLAEAKVKDVNKEQVAVNINTADAATLAAALNGIGIKKAEAIIAHREQLGKFTSAEQLLEVKGIGKATLDKNRDKIKL
ncbi:MAG: competence protein ComE [Moraxellaceae bacterium]|nr:MAG: competence protein ComE [Moraxellaceae bacterium]